MSVSRRSLLSAAVAAPWLAAVPGAALAGTANLAGKGRPVSATELRWLDGTPPSRFEGATLGVPWPRGTVKADTAFRLANGAALQSWPLAYWPDGSLKWSAHAVAADAPRDGFAIVPGKPALPKSPVAVKRAADAITVTSGDLAWVVPTSGEHLIASATVAGRVTMKDAKLVALSQDQPDLDATGRVSQQRFASKVTKVAVEQSGPVRAVLKVDGTHSGNGREWLPFSVRLYFHAGAEGVRIVHSFIFDGDPAKDFLRGLGLSAKVPMTDATYDRHLRLAGEGPGVWGEAVRPVTGLRRDPGQAFKDAQVAGQALPPLAGMAKPVQDGLKWVPEWGDVSLSQLTPDGFQIRKRTRAGHAWIESNAGTRSKGLAYAGGVSGGVALGFKDFWQRSPTQLDIRNAHAEMAEITAWLWSPDAPAMDVRPYRSADGMLTSEQEIEGLNITYEDYQQGWDSALGVARTSELNLWVLKATPSHETFSAMAEQVANPARLTPSPERIQQCGVFGDWDVADSSTPARKLIEDRLTYQIDHYIREVEQRRWYGFWSHGDVMHTYDADRHVWRYDIGGYAWDNSELSTDLWAWYTFLRTGRADVFKFAEAMTRHTGEVDVYHLGRFKGFGTRHGVQHWSDSSKQPRVSNAAYRRIYYYLTADERVGDLMRDLLDSDYRLKDIDIGRKLQGADEAPPLPEGVIGNGYGTHWGSFVSAWLTEWERTGDTRWRDRIVNGMQTIGSQKRRWFTHGGPYELKTGKFLDAGDKSGQSHLAGVFGVVEMSSELLSLIDEPLYRRAWLEYCRYYNGTREENMALLGKAPNRNLRDAHSRLTAYAAFHEKDKALALRAWSELLGNRGGVTRQTKRVDGAAVLRPIDEDAGLGTNGVAQWGLAAIQNLALVGDSLDEAARIAGLK